MAKQDLKERYADRVEGEEGSDEELKIVDGSLRSVPERLSDLGTLYEERNKEYADAYKRFGKVMNQLFPDGLFIQGEKQFNQLGCFVQIISKSARYSTSLGKGDHHEDCCDDISVYAQMMQEIGVQD